MAAGAEVKAVTVVGQEWSPAAAAVVVTADVSAFQASLAEQQAAVAVTGWSHIQALQAEAEALLAIAVLHQLAQPLQVM